MYLALIFYMVNLFFLAFKSLISSISEKKNKRLFDSPKVENVLDV